jgi:hypothetical protein
MLTLAAAPQGCSMMVKADAHLAASLPKSGATQNCLKPVMAEQPRHAPWHKLALCFSRELPLFRITMKEPASRRSPGPLERFALCLTRSPFV